MKLAISYAIGVAAVLVLTAAAPLVWTLLGLAGVGAAVAAIAPRALRRRVAPLVVGLLVLALLGMAPTAARLL